MKSPIAPVTPPIPPELAGEIDAAQSMISFLLMQRTGANPDRVIAFTQWEKKVRAELAVLQAKARASHPADTHLASDAAGKGTRQ